jgi:hypothetical protein
MHRLRGQVTDKMRTVEGIAESLSRPEPAQPQEGKDGDPQLAALYQCLTHFSDLTNIDCIVDVGSGNGVLAHAVAKIWHEKPACPCYVAVDLEEPLNKLSMPASIHNNSRKVTFESFFDVEVDKLSDRIKLVVVRNVFHELDIILTARIIAGLNKSLNVGTEVYIQDMATLPKPERSNAGWDPVCFEQFLKAIGLAPTKAELKSHSGISWFTTRFKTNGSSLDVGATATECAKQRIAQKRRMHQQLRELNSDYNRDGVVADVIYLSLEIASIDGQLGTFEEAFGNRKNSNHDAMLVSGMVPLKPSTETQLYEIPVPKGKAMARSFGLVAMLRGKDDVDIPKLIRSSQADVWFCGYSQKLTFQLEDNKTAILDAAGRGVRLRFLIVDPRSQAAAVRALHPVYDDKDELFRDISMTRGSFLAFLNEYELARTSFKNGLLSMRYIATIPACSYFIVDQMCFASLYTQRLTGTSAPCFIFSSAPEGYSGYYEMLREDFKEAFETSSEIEFSDKVANNEV